MKKEMGDDKIPRKPITSSRAKSYHLDKHQVRNRRAMPNLNCFHESISRMRCVNSSMQITINRAIKGHMYVSHL